MASPARHRHSPTPRIVGHTTQSTEQRVEARRKGGHHSAKVMRLRGLVPPPLTAVYERLEQALTEVHGGELDPKVAQAMASLARAMVNVLTAGELEERVRRLEAGVPSKERRSLSW